MENFFYSDEFCSDICDLLSKLDLEDDEDVDKLPEDWAIVCEESVLETIVTLTPEWIAEMVNEERWPEDDESTVNKFIKVLKENIDFNKINAELPELYYQTRKKFTVTKAGLIEASR